MGVGVCSNSRRGRGHQFCDLATFLKWQHPRVASKTGMHLPNFLSPLQVPRTSSGHVPPLGFPSPKDVLPFSKDFPALLILRTHLPNRFLKCGLTRSPSPTTRSRARAGEPRGTRTERPPACSVPAESALPTSHPGPSRSHKQPYNKQGDGIWRPRPGAHRLGATPHPRRAARSPNRRAPGERREGKAARGRQAGMEGGTAL